jgi:glucose-6-phosphate isomerase
VATAAAGRVLGINPFDQPDVEDAKKAARALLDSPADTSEPDFTDGPVTVQALGGDWLGDADTLVDAVHRLLGAVDAERGYLAVMAYVDRVAHADLEEVRDSLARRLHRPVTFGWGPRFLHSTGQFHKGGPAQGVFLQVTAEPREDLEVPGRDFGFATLISAQAAGDAQVLADHGRPVLRVHLKDPASGIARLREALA